MQCNMLSLEEIANVRKDVDKIVNILYGGNMQEHYPKSRNITLICGLFPSIDWVYPTSATTPIMSAIRKKVVIVNMNRKSNC